MADVVMLVTAVRPLHVVMSRTALSVSECVSCCCYYRYL